MSLRLSYHFQLFLAESLQMAQPECIINSLNAKSSAVPNKQLSILKGMNQLGFVEISLKTKKSSAYLPMYFF